MRKTASVTQEITEVDVAILGGSVHGAALFRDLCAQGVTCLMGDTADFGAGFSVAGTRILEDRATFTDPATHCIAHAGATERAAMRAAAPHLVHPLTTLMPLYRATESPFADSATASLNTVIQALKAPGAGDLGTLLTKSEAQRALPNGPPNVSGVVQLDHATITTPERYVWELIKEGLAAEPKSGALNHCAMSGRNGNVFTVTPHEKAPFLVRPRVVVNSAGPWVDHVNVDLGLPTRYLRFTKCTYALLKNQSLSDSLGERALASQAETDQLLMLRPFAGMVLLGPDETPSLGPHVVNGSRAEVARLLEKTRALFPDIVIDDEDVAFVYAGLRPILQDQDTADTQSLHDAEGHVLVDGPVQGRPFPVLSLVGGPWTLHQQFVSRVSARILLHLGHTRRATTTGAPLGGGRDYPPDPVDWIAAVANRTGLTTSRVGQLFHRYGTTAAEVAAYEATHPHAKICGSYSHAELAWIALHEEVKHLDDLVLRRTDLAIAGRVTAADIAMISVVVGGVLGWDSERSHMETSRLLDQLTRRHRMRL